MRSLKREDHLGHLIARGTLSRDDLTRGLIETMTQRRYLAGHGIPSVPTRYVVSMHTGDRAWFAPDTEDLLVRTLTAHAERAGYLLIGGLEVELECDDALEQGAPTYWAGFRDTDLLVLAGPKAALDVFASRA